MKIVRDPAELQSLTTGYRARGLSIGFVPTMGYLHAGHLALMKHARAMNVSVASIFVNPTQFGPSEDLSRYPRDEQGDLQKCQDAGVDVVFLPTPTSMYPAGFQTSVDVSDVAQGLCGASRPGHFRGVATVVHKLFNLVQPNQAFFGEKDFQQLAVIRTFVRDLALRVNVVGVPTLREPDGLAMSSRNVFLSPEHRQDALVLKRALDAVAQADHRDTAALEALGRNIIAQVASARLDYFSVVDATSLRPSERPTRALVAAFFGATRLIDNVAL